MVAPALASAAVNEEGETVNLLLLEVRFTVLEMFVPVSVKVFV